MTKRGTGKGTIRILMVCHGNICRSTMAEYVMRHLVSERGLSSRILVDSAAATRDAEGWPVHRSTQEVLHRHGIPCGDHHAWQMSQADYDLYDLICGMDEENLADIYHILDGRMRRGWHWKPMTDADIANADPAGKVHLLLDWSTHPRAIADPWYTDDYDTTYRDVLEGCESLLAHLVSEGV